MNTNHEITVQKEKIDQADNIYVVGYINAIFTSLSLEKAFYQNLDISSPGYQLFSNVNDSVELNELNQFNNHNANTDLAKALSDPSMEHIARDMKWTLDQKDEGTLYQLIPSSQQDLRLLIANLAPPKIDSNSSDNDLIVIGQSQTESLEHEPLLSISNMLPCGPNIILHAIMQSNKGKNYDPDNLIALIRRATSLANNSGIGAANRAINFNLYNNITFYTQAYSLLYNTHESGPNPHGYQLTAVRTRQITHPRDTVKMIFDFQGINSGAPQSWYSEIDVTGEYPFLLTAWSSYLDLN